MKNSKLKIVLVLFLAFGITTANSQDSAKEISNKNSSSTKVVKKVKDEKGNVDEKVDAKGGTFTESVNTQKGKPVQVKKDATDEMKKLRMEYGKKIEDAKDPKEQARLKAEMTEKMSKIKGASDDTAMEVVSNTDKDSKEGSKTKPVEKPKGSTTASTGKPTVAVKNDKVTSANANLSAKRQNLENSKKMVAKANAKIAATKAKLEKAKADETITKEEAASQEAKIAAAEAKVKRLEASIQNAEKKYKEKEEKLSGFTKDQKN